jgi:hypothetical protein
VIRAGNGKEATMPVQRNPLNVVGAAGICASLALLGWEINTRDHADSRFLSITVTHDTDSDEGIVPPPDENHRRDGLDGHNWSPNGHGSPDDDDDFYGGPAEQDDPDSPTPI